MIIRHLLIQSGNNEKGQKELKNYNIKAALFDLDGVVVFTDKYHYLAWKQLSDEMGWEFDEQINQQLRGIPRLASLEKILEHNQVELPLDKKTELMNLKNEYYVKLLEKINEDDIYPGVVDFIKNLRAKGTKIALCSSSKNAELVLNKLELNELFDAVVTGKDIKNAKPDPEIFLLGAKKLKTPKFHCVVFEDAKAGIEGAIAAGMKSIGVGNREETEELADQFISDYNEIDIEAFLESGKKQAMPIHETKIIERDFDKKDILHTESMFSLGNGYIGLRGTYDELDEAIGMCDGMYLNGVFATEPYHHIHVFPGYAKRDAFTVNLADWRIFDLYIDGEKACFSNKNIKEHQRELDMKNGWVDRKFIFETASGKRAEVQSCRIVNLDTVNTAQIRYKVTALNFAGEVVLKSLIVKTTKLNGEYRCSLVSEKNSDTIYSFVQKVDTTDCKVASAFMHTVYADNKDIIERNDENVYCYEVKSFLSNHDSLTVEKYAAFSTNLDAVDDMEEAARKDVRENHLKGFDQLKREQSEAWQEHWEAGDIEIQGNPADQQAVRFCLFHLRQQLPIKNQCSIGATGLTGPGYSGKVYWDTEMYMMPYFNFTEPEKQKELLMYRYKYLDKARARAKEFDTVGAMYPWCGIDGEETSVIFEASTAEYHLGSDIAFAIWRYCDSTGDTEFLYNFGAEILFETAKFISHRGQFIDARGGRFCINTVCGPDEYACGVSNNMYTNMMAQYHLRYALSVVDDMKMNSPERYDLLEKKVGLTEAELTLWRNAADRMYYRYNEELGIHEQDDSFVYKDPVDMESCPMNVDIRFLYHPLDLWRKQVSKQADIVLLNFIQGDKFSFEEKMRDYDYYEPKCNHGSSLSTGIHAIMAAELEKPEAYEFFRCSAYMDIKDFKNNTANGLHMACLGSVWMSVVNGFLGMRHYTNGLLFNPHIPKAWDSYQCRIKYKGSRIEVNVERDKTTFTLISGNNFSFNISEENVVLTLEKPEFVLCHN